MGDNQPMEATSKGNLHTPVSPSSSFEALDPHDPNLSKLATNMFQKTTDYLQGELTSTSDNYKLLENMNITAKKQLGTMTQYASDLRNTLDLQNEYYINTIKPYLLQIDTIETSIDKLEKAAYRLDCYTLQLETRLQDLKTKNNQ